LSAFDAGRVRIEDKGTSSFAIALYLCIADQTAGSRKCKGSQRRRSCGGGRDSCRRLSIGQ
jgi:hypothetical protein